MDKLPSPPEEPQSTPEKHLQDRTPWPNGKVPKNLCVRLQILATKVVISKQVDDYDESLSNDLYECLGQMQDITLTMSLPAFERLKKRVGVVLKPYFLFLDLKKARITFEFGGLFFFFHLGLVRKKFLVDDS